MSSKRLAALGASLLVLILVVGMAAVRGPLGATLGLRDDRPNVLIVLWDTVRADRLTPYDPTRKTTPNLDKWAEKGIVFEHAVSPGMWTVPSHASMFTGLPPTTHGTGMDRLWLNRNFLTLAEWLSTNGYATYAFSANPNLSPRRLNLLQGFEHIDVSWQGRARQIALQNAKQKLHPRDASTEISPLYTGLSPSEPQSMHWDAGPATWRAFTHWLDNRPADDRPWMAYLSYMEAHKPRIPSMAARKAVADDKTIEMMLSTDISFDSQLLYSYRQKEYTAAELRAINLAYDATLWDLDRTTSALFAHLEERGELDNTIVVFTSDHGEQLGEHHLFGHRNGVYQALLHVPLIVRWDGHLDPRRVTKPVSTIDLFDTVVALTGVPEPDGRRSGGNWVQEEAGEWGVFAESLDLDTPGYRRVSRLSPGLVDNPWERTFRAIYDGRHKLMMASDGEKRLFDLATDPMERTDRTEVDPERVAEMTHALEELVERLPPYDPSLATADDNPVEDDEATDDYLKVLGYLDEDE